MKQRLMSPWGQCEPGTGQPDTLHSFLKSCGLPTKPWTRVLAGLQGASGGQQTPYLELVSKPGPTAERAWSGRVQALGAACTSPSTAAGGSWEAPPGRGRNMGSRGTGH